MSSFPMSVATAAPADDRTSMASGDNTKAAQEAMRVARQAMGLPINLENCVHAIEPNCGRPPAGELSFFMNEPLNIPFPNIKDPESMKPFAAACANRFLDVAVPIEEKKDALMQIKTALDSDNGWAKQEFVMLRSLHGALGEYMCELIHELKRVSEAKDAVGAAAMDSTATCNNLKIFFLHLQNVLEKREVIDQADAYEKANEDLKNENAYSEAHVPTLLGPLLPNGLLNHLKLERSTEFSMFEGSHHMTVCYRDLNDPAKMAEHTMRARSSFLDKAMVESRQSHAAIRALKSALDPAGELKTEYALTNEYLENLDDLRPDLLESADSVAVLQQQLRTKAEQQATAFNNLNALYLTLAGMVTTKAGAMTAKSAEEQLKEAAEHAAELQDQISKKNEELEHLRAVMNNLGTLVKAERREKERYAATTKEKLAAE